MKQRAQRIITGLATVGASLALAQGAQAQALVSNIPGAVVLERILVKVNGGLVTQSDLERAQIRALRVRGNPPQTDAELQQVIQEITPDLIVNEVEELLLVERAHEFDLPLDLIDASDARLALRTVLRVDLLVAETYRHTL